LSRAGKILPSTEGLGANAIIRETGKTKTYVWRWQVSRLKTSGPSARQNAPSAHSRLDASIAGRIISLTMEARPGNTTHWGRARP